jgi:hypothetical protein
MNNYADPNTDFGLEQELLVKALKEAEGQRAVRIQGGSLQNIGSGQMGYSVGSGPGGALDAALTRAMGEIGKPAREQDMRDLSSEETRRYDELSRQMNEPGTVDYEDPQSMAADNARRMGVASQMSKLPMAKQMAQTYLSKGAAFPETVALMRAKQIEAGQQNALRLQAAQEQQAARLEQQRLQQEQNNQMKLMGLGIQQQGLDLKTATAKAKEDAAQEKKATQNDAYLGSLNRLEEIVNDVKTTPNLSAALGAIEGRLHPLIAFSPAQKSNAASKIKNLQEYLQTKGLEDLRRAGVAPGSVTEKEWSKFAARAGNIDPTLDESNFNRELDNLLRDVNAARAKAMLAPMGGSEVRSFGGKTYTLKPGADSKLRSSWVEQ